MVEVGRSLTISVFKGDRANGQRKPSPKPKPKPNTESEPKSESETTAAAGPKPAQEEGWTFPDNSRPYGGKPNRQGNTNSDPQPTLDSRPQSEPGLGSESKPEAAHKPQARPSENNMKVPAAAPEKKLLPWIRYTGWKPNCGMRGLKEERLCGSRPYCASFKSPYLEKMHEPPYASEAECLAARESPLTSKSKRRGESRGSRGIRRQGSCGIAKRCPPVRRCAAMRSSATRTGIRRALSRGIMPRSRSASTTTSYQSGRKR